MSRHVRGPNGFVMEVSDAVGRGLVEEGRTGLYEYADPGDHLEGTATVGGREKDDGATGPRPRTELVSDSDVDRSDWAPKAYDRSKDDDELGPEPRTETVSKPGMRRDDVAVPSGGSASEPIDNDSDEADALPSKSATKAELEAYAGRNGVTLPKDGTKQDYLDALGVK